MHPDYENIYRQMANTAGKLGFRLTRNEAFEAVFSGPRSWRIILDGDPHTRPAFDLAVARTLPSGGTERFSIRLLMEVYFESRRLPKEKPSLDNQLRFLEEQTDYIFTEVGIYREAYRKKDQL
jgi:hypothetical protein